MFKADILILEKIQLCPCLVEKYVEMKSEFYIFILIYKKGSNSIVFCKISHIFIIFLEINVDKDPKYFLSLNSDRITTYVTL